MRTQREGGARREGLVDGDAGGGLMKASRARAVCLHHGEMRSMGLFSLRLLAGLSVRLHCVYACV